MGHIPVEFVESFMHVYHPYAMHIKVTSRESPQANGQRWPKVVGITVKSGREALAHLYRCKCEFWIGCASARASLQRETTSSRCFSRGDRAVMKPPTLEIVRVPPKAKPLTPWNILNLTWRSASGTSAWLCARTLRPRRWI